MVFTSRSRAVAIMHEMFDVMYQCSDPPISWYEILDITDSGEVHGYDMHFLDVDECNGIYEEYRKKLPLFYQRQLSWQFLNYAPSGDKKAVDKVLSGV